MTKTSNLIKELDRILKSEILIKEERTLLIKKLVLQFEKKSHLQYPLSNNSCLILTKDIRTVNNPKRYRNSPFPLITNVGLFSNSTGEWNSTLKAYGLNSRQKLEDEPNNWNEVGNKIFLVHTSTLNSRANLYLKRQYRRLETYRKNRQIDQYWKLSWDLMSNWSFKITCLNSWNSRWYRTLKVREIRKIFTDLQNIVNYRLRTTLITNVWIESPKGKWRQLGIPPKSWRLYLHMLNMFITYISEPTLNKTEYEGFIYNRGVTSWWADLIWSKILSSHQSIIEVDLSSGFPNLSLLTVRQALISQGLIPLNLINLILTHLLSPLKESTTFPNLTSYLENLYNQKWRTGYRSVHMGLGISPILFVLTLKWVLESLKIKNPGLIYKWYADDGSIYFTLRGLWTLLRQYQKSWIWIFKELILGRNLFLSLLNPETLMRESGVKFCPRKSSLIRLFGIWLQPYKSLGLMLKSSSGILSQIYWSWLRQKPAALDLYGSTRGRGDNPTTGKVGTRGSNKHLNLKNDNSQLPPLNYELLKTHYKKFFGYLTACLFSSPPNTTPLRSPKSLYHGSLLQIVKTEHKHQPCVPLNKYNTGSRMNELLLSIYTSSPSAFKTTQIKRLLSIPKYQHSPIDLNLIANPLLPYENYDKLDYYFNKESELNIDSEELRRLTAEYHQKIKNKSV